MTLLQGLPPVVSSTTRLMILGSFPSAVSLAAQQYYAHPRNHLWPIVGTLFGLDLKAMPYEERLVHLRQRGLGLWDVYAACKREGSLDSNIQDAQLNDLACLKHQAPKLMALAHNGGESARSMRVTQALGYEVFRLPSTSPANASWSFERKLEAWRYVFVHTRLIPPT